jgi:hypothetical protein
MLSWSKVLSTTDAQQQTTGGIVPYLRLTSSGLSSGNFQTWFRQTFFNCCSWHPGSFNSKPVEEAIVSFQVIIQGQLLGNIAFTVTHDQSRQYNNNAPNTWLHWPSQMSSLLQATNYAGRQVVLTRDNQNVFTFEIN